MSQLELQIKSSKVNWIYHKTITNQIKKTIKSKLDELNKKLAKLLNGCQFKLEPKKFSPENNKIDICVF